MKVLSVVLCLLTAGMVFGQNVNDVYWVADPNGSWTEASNWYEDTGDGAAWGVPGSTSGCGAYAVISNGGTANIGSGYAPAYEVERIYVGGAVVSSLEVKAGVSVYNLFTTAGTGYQGYLAVTAGTLDVTGTSYLGQGVNSNTVVDIFGGKLEFSGHCYMPGSDYSGSVVVMNVEGGDLEFVANGYVGNKAGSDATINLNSGTFYHGGSNFCIGNYGAGTLNVYGGSLTTNSTDRWRIGWASGAEGTINIYGGSFVLSKPVALHRGTFRVIGSDISQLEMPQFLCVDGAGETLEFVIDEGGITQITIMGSDTTANIADLDDCTLSIDVEEGVSIVEGAIYTLLTAVNPITIDGAMVTQNLSDYNFSYFVEQDSVSGLYCLRIRSAGSYHWDSADGYWDVDGNWLEGSVPTVYDSAIAASGIINIPNAAIGIDSVTLDSCTLNVEQGSLTTNSSLNVGTVDGSNVTINQTTGVFTVGNEFNLGHNDTEATGNVQNFNLSGGTFSASGVTYVGGRGHYGYYTQSGGDVTLGSSFRCGYDGGYGVIEISGGSLYVTDYMTVREGEFRIMGSDITSIELNRLDLDSEPDDTITFGLDADGVTEINVYNTYAKFNGATIRVEALPGYDGVPGDYYDVLRIENTKSLVLSNTDVVSTTGQSFGAEVYDDGTYYHLRLLVGGAKASAPSPADGYLQPAVDYEMLAWSNPGSGEVTGTVTCDVFLTVGSDPDFLSAVQLVDKLSVDTFDLSTMTPPLDPNTTYLWRVDVYDSTSGGETHVIGDVWTFKTTLAAVEALKWDFESQSSSAAGYQQAVGYDSIQATASSSYNVDVPAATINGFGLEGLKHGTSAGNYGYGMWMTDGDFEIVSAPGSNVTGSAWIKYDFDQAYNLGQMFVWNHNQSDVYGVEETQKGIKNATIEYSTDGTTYSTLMSTVFSDATHAAEYDSYDTIDFGGLSVKSVIITAASTGGSYGSNYRGLSEVRFGLNGTSDTVITVPDASGNTARDGSGYSNGLPDIVGSEVLGSSYCAEFVDSCDYIYSHVDDGGFPYQGSAQWSMSVYVYLDRMPDEGTVIAGFGNVTSYAGGSRRHLYVGADGMISFMLDYNTKVQSTRAFDLGKWQLITVTYEGNYVRLYKNNQWLKTSSVSLSDAVAKAVVAPRTGLRVGENGVYNSRGKIDDFTVYSGVLSRVEMQALTDRLPVESDFDVDGDVDITDLGAMAGDWLAGEGAMGSYSNPGLTGWVESCENLTGFQSNWTAYLNNWAGKDIVAGAGVEGSGALELSLTSGYIKRSFGWASDLFEVSFSYKSESDTLDSYDYVSITDANDKVLAIIGLFSSEGVTAVRMIAAGAVVKSFDTATDYIEVSLRLDAGDGRMALYVDGVVVEYDVALYDNSAGDAANIEIEHFGTNPKSYFDEISVGAATGSIDYPAVDLSGDGHVDLSDYALFAQDWIAGLE